MAFAVSYAWEKSVWTRGDGVRLALETFYAACTSVSGRLIAVIWVHWPYAYRFRVHSTNLRRPRRETVAATRYQYSRASRILVSLNMLTLPISIPSLMPIPSILLVEGGWRRVDGQSDLSRGEHATQLACINTGLCAQRLGRVWDQPSISRRGPRAPGCGRTRVGGKARRERRVSARDVCRSGGSRRHGQGNVLTWFWAGARQGGGTLLSRGGSQPIGGAKNLIKAAPVPARQEAVCNPWVQAPPRNMALHACWSLLFRHSSLFADAIQETAYRPGDPLQALCTAHPPATTSPSPERLSLQIVTSS
jgi:hypothetical protein